MSAIERLSAPPVIAPPTWRDHDADALEARADTIMAATLALHRLDGMFETRTELADAVGNAANLLRVEEDNLRGRAQRLRGTA